MKNKLFQLFIIFSKNLTMFVLSTIYKKHLITRDVGMCIFKVPYNIYKCVIWNMYYDIIKIYSNH